MSFCPPPPKNRTERMSFIPLLFSFSVAHSTGITRRLEKQQKSRSPHGKVSSGEIEWDKLDTIGLADGIFWSSSWIKCKNPRLEKGQWTAWQEGYNSFCTEYLFFRGCETNDRRIGKVHACQKKIFCPTYFNVRAQVAIFAKRLWSFR